MVNLGVLINDFILTGIDIHFVHVKPPRLPEGQAAKPLLMVHGWPGSFYEFYKIIPLLTDPASHGLGDEHIFEVICPSIPGYGFSEAPHKKGMTQEKKLNPHEPSLTVGQPLLAQQQLLLHTSCFPSEEPEILCVVWEEGDKGVTLGDITN